MKFKHIKNGKSPSDYQKTRSEKPEILLITSYPPRECGIATYSQDLLNALKAKFNESFSIRVCAIETKQMGYSYPDEVQNTVDTMKTDEFEKLADTINYSGNISMVLVQHEFGLFRDNDLFIQFLVSLDKPVAVVFHTVLPYPDEKMALAVRNIAAASSAIIVMTNNAEKVLRETYEIPAYKINVIPHGTHLVQHKSKDQLKKKYDLSGRKVLSTFGLLSSGKGIETTLNALPEICRENPEVMFLIIGKTHPEIIKSQGEIYRESLEVKIEELGIHDHVRFVNRYLPLEDLLEYLQLTDIYLFTSIDPHQTVSGTFSYAKSCGCPIISTPIPHAMEVLSENTGIIVDFQQPGQLSEAVNRLMGDEKLRATFSANALQRIAPTSWENSAILHAKLFERLCRLPHHLMMARNTPKSIHLTYSLPNIHLTHLRKLTTENGVIQFSKINQPDIHSGYTLDDNARALIAACMYYKQTSERSILREIDIYLKAIAYCQQPEGDFLNYFDEQKRFTAQNFETNLSDSNGRAIWAIGYLISVEELLPKELGVRARAILEKAKKKVSELESPRAKAFSIKGLYYSNVNEPSEETSLIIKRLAQQLVEHYQDESEEGWLWFEPYLTYANAILPEALLCAWQDQGVEIYKKIAKTSFDFLISRTFRDQQIKVISNSSWLKKGCEPELYGEQPIDIAYTILALERFYKVFDKKDYLEKSKIAFDWFLGKNHLSQIVYNPCTGGCYDGVEETQVNLNQGAESTLSYLISRLTIETLNIKTEKTGRFAENTELRI